METAGNNKRRLGPRSLHPNRRVERLIRAADKLNVATEMISVLGFLTEERSLTDTTNENLKQYSHSAGFPFTCHRVFRDWCYVTPKKRQSWCQGRNFSNEVLESVCDFVTTVMEKLHPDSSTERTTFRRDTKTAEKCILKLFLEEFAEDLSVYSGSQHLGYFRLKDSLKIRPPDVKNILIPSKYALLFTLNIGRVGKKGNRQVVKKCTLYLPESAVTEYLPKCENAELLKETSQKLFNKVTVFQICDICPGILSKLFSSKEGKDNFVEKVKARESMKTKVCDVFVDVDFVNMSLTVHLNLSHPEETESIVLDEIKSLLAQEKDDIKSSLVGFEYPKPGSGMTLRVSNNGKVCDAVSSELSADDKNTLSIYFCCQIPVELGIKEALRKYGDLKQEISNRDADTAKPEERLWGKIHCASEEQKKALFRDISSETVFSYPFIQHVSFRSRPEFKTDSSGIEFVRVSLRQIATPVNKVTIHRNANSWVPSKKYVVIGKDPCKIWWCKNGDGVFNLNNRFLSNQKIQKAIREYLGKTIGEYQLTISRDEKPRFRCFAREKAILESLIKTVPNATANFDVVLNRISKDKVYYTDFVDFFEDGEEFVKEFQKAKENKEMKTIGHIWVHDVEYYSVMMVKPDVYECIKGGIDVVCETAARNRLGVIIDVSTDRSGMVILKVHGRNEYNVKKVSRVVRKVISSEVVRPEDETPKNRNYMFPYLSSAGGKILMNTIEAALGVKCLHQPQENKLYIYGPPPCKEEARQRIVNFVKKLPDTIHISPPNVELKLALVKHLMKVYGKDLESLIRQCGVKSLYWDSKSGCFTVWGSPDRIGECNLRINEANEYVAAAAKASTSCTMCVACLCPIEGFPFRLSLCGHNYCESCINVHVNVAIGDRSLPILCVKEGCHEVIVLKDIGRSCNYSKEGLRQLLEASVSLFIAQQGESSPVRHCVTPDCSGLYFVSKDQYSGHEITCGTCGVSICDCCGVSPFHKNFTCSLWKNKEHLDEDTARWFSENEATRKMCPRCAVGIEKIDGCNNVFCTNCKASICFRCMEHFDDSSSCYTHLSEVHDGPY